MIERKWHGHLQIPNLSYTKDVFHPFPARTRYSKRNFSSPCSHGISETPLLVACKSSRPTSVPVGVAFRKNETSLGPGASYSPGVLLFTPSPCFHAGMKLIASMWAIVDFFIVWHNAKAKVNKRVCQENNKIALTRHMLPSLIALLFQSSVVTDRTKSCV